jgi:hypothetical protein
MLSTLNKLNIRIRTSFFQFNGRLLLIENETFDKKGNPRTTQFLCSYICKNKRTMTESQSGIKLSPSDSQHHYIRDGYFGEVGQMWPGN